MTASDCKPAIADGGVFVVGVWRSGTSLFYALLNQHPDIALMYETDLPTFAPLFAPHRAAWPERVEFWNSAFSRHRIEDLQQESAGIRDLAQASEFVYRSFAERHQARVWGDKSPTYAGRCRKLAELFPRARFMVIWRDPAEICGSVMQAARGNDWFARRGSLTRALFAVPALIRDVAWLREHGREVQEIFFDQLVTEPENVMRNVAKFLGVPYDERMSSLRGADRTAIYDGAHHDSVKSEAIRGSRQKTPGLAPDLQGKIDRYRIFWSRRFGQVWHKRPESANTGAEPGLPERVLDVLKLSILHTLDKLVLFTYCSVPIIMLEVYRRSKKTRAMTREALRSNT